MATKKVYWFETPTGLGRKFDILLSQLNVPYSNLFRSLMYNALELSEDDLLELLAEGAKKEILERKEAVTA